MSALGFGARTFPRKVYSPLGLFTYSFFLAGIFHAHFFRQGNQPNQIKSSKTNLKHNLNISNLTQPNPT